MGMAVREVWGHNVEEELATMDAALDRFGVISIDTEFPGSILKTERDADENQRYSAMKFNVENTNVIQLGITLSDWLGGVFATWEFNFAFDLERERHADDSIEFLKKNGIDFERLKSHGIDISEFGRALGRILRPRMNLVWVTFHGLYDLAYVMHVLDKWSLPDTSSMFAEIARSMFGTVVDVKFMARFCGGLQGGELGLQKLANILGIERFGGAHHAGSDSLLTCRVFAAMRMMFRLQADQYQGFLYGISAKICNMQHRKYALAPRYRPVMVPALRYCPFNAVSLVPHGAMFNSVGVLYVPVGFLV